MAALSASGSLVYATGSTDRLLVRVDQSGAARPLDLPPGQYATPRYSPDGTRIALEVSSATGTDVRLFDLASGVLSPLGTGGSANGGNQTAPAWSPDGKHVVFAWSRDGRRALWWQAADGSDSARLLFSEGAAIGSGILSRDGRTLLYTSPTRPGQEGGLRYVSLDGADRTVKEFAVSPAMTVAGRFSPDGRWVAYSSDESGVSQVYVRPFPGPARRYQVSVDGGTEPVWAPDGRRIFFRDGRRLMAATVTRGPSGADFAVARRDVLFENDFSTGWLQANYDVSPGGSHFLMIRPREREPQVVVVQNWGAELRGRRGPRPPE
jgi:serine/threonine-protein kinase